MMQEVWDLSTQEAGSKLGKSFSRIDNSGSGLFALKKIREGKTVGEYFGDEIIKGHDYGTVNNLIATYSMGNHDESIIYCAFSVHRNRMLCMAGYINDPLDDDKCNVRAVWRGHRCFIVATRDIKKGEELLMAYGATYWMRDCWDSDLIRQAWNNYGTRRTDNQWRNLYNQCLLAEQDPEETSEDGSVWEEEGGREVVMRQRIIIDLTLGDEPVVTVVQELATPLVPPEEPPAFVPYTLESPEMSEDYVVIRNSCA
jgi:hypothetical protein